MLHKSMTISYEVEKNLYLNLTNQCPCSCVFCIRKNDDGAYGSDPLWLEHEPTMQEVQADLQKRDMAAYNEIVFCGYGEPLMRLHFVCTLAAWLRQQYPSVCLRLNTNGLADIYQRQEASAGGTGAAEQVAAVFDKVSVSLNAGNATLYDQVTHPRQPGAADAFATMLHFARTCREHGAEVCFTVVDVISEAEIAQARELADSLGIPLHVREYIQ